jgi:hypothetical protein
MLAVSVIIVGGVLLVVQLEPTSEREEGRPESKPTRASLVRVAYLIDVLTLKGTETTDRASTSAFRRIGPPSRRRFGRCSSVSCISCCAVCSSWLSAPATNT